MVKKYKEIIILLVCLLAIFQLYLFTAFPSFKNDDSPETTASAYTLGISHPPGYPLFTMAAKIFSLLPIGSPAFRVNLFSIFLAMLVLFLSYFLIKKNNRLVLGYENKIINFLGVFIPAFSYILWNQAIEAKGGIYMLNLLFFAALIYSGIELLRGYSLKHFYLVSFIYGLSLANHWPSIIILLPVFGYLFFRHRGKMSRKNTMTALLLLLAGLSPYIYLPVRGGSEGIFAFAARPDTWENFWGTVLKTVNSNPQPPPSFQLYRDQVSEFLKLFFTDFSFLWVLIFFGGYAVWKKNRKYAVFYMSMFLIIVVMVVFYNRSEKQLIWFIDNFLIPAQYILLILILCGIYFILSLAGRKVYKYIFSAVLAAAILYSGYRHFMINNNSRNYIPYDFGNNALMTLEPGSFYLPEGNYAMSFRYVERVAHNADNINFFMLNNLAYKWGIEDFTKKYGQVYLEPNKPGLNVINIINSYFPKNNIYFSYNYFQQNKNYLPNLQIQAKGLLYKVAAENAPVISTGIFRAYEYRGIFGAKSDIDKTVVSVYGDKLTSQANEFIDEKKYTEAIQALKYALLFPADPLSRVNICCILSYVYQQAKDVDNQINSLKQAINIQPDFYKPYEILGMIYYNNKQFRPSEEMFNNAIKYNSPNSHNLEQYLRLMIQNPENIK